MADQSLFEQTELQIDPSKDYLPELVGDDKKYKTPADLARSVLHKEGHIARLERENRELREDLVKRSTVDDLMEKLAPKLSTGVSNSSVTTTGEGNPEGVKHNETQPQLSKEDIKRILAEEREAEKIAKNVEFVKERITAVLGHNSQQYVLEKTKELGMSEAQAFEIAKTNPTAFLKLMDVKEALQQEQALNSLFSPSKGSVNTTPMMSHKQNNGRKTFKEWQDIRRKDPSKYHAEYINMHKDAQALGEDFYS